MEFFEHFKLVCAKLQLQASLLDLLKLLERRFVVTHLLFRKYEKLFQHVLDVSDYRGSPTAKSEALRFGWLLFLTAKEKILPDMFPDLVAALNVLICALSLTLYSWHYVPDPGLLALCRQCGCDADKVTAVRQSLFDPMISGMLKNNILFTEEDATSSDETRMRSLQAPSVVAKNLASLEREYRRSPNICFDETLALLSPSPPEGTPARSAFVSPLAALSPHTGLLKSIDWLESLVRRVSADEPSPLLLKYFASCGENDFLKNGRALLTTVKERLTAERIENLPERFVYVQKLYFLLLETLLRSEEDKLQQKGTNFALLLSNEAFHRSLVWCACEIVFYSFRAERAFYPHNLAIVGVTALDLIKIIESVLRNLNQLSSVMVRRMSDIEEHLLEFFAWKRNDVLWTYLETPGVREVLGEWLGSEVLPTVSTPQQQHHQQQMLHHHHQNVGSSLSSSAASAVAFAASMASVAHSQIGFASPARPPPRVGGGAPNLSFGAKLFFRKISTLINRRVEQLCNGLGMAFLIQGQICKTAMHAILKTRLCFDRHLDQIILCSIYAVGKVYWKSAGVTVAGAQEITFKDIVACYKTLPHFSRLTAQIFREVLLADGSKASIIDFYNQLFVPEMDEFVLRFQAEYGQILGTQPLVTPRAMRVLDASVFESGSTAPAATFRNVSVSPMKGRSGSPASGSFRSTKLSIVGGRSPSRDLAQISANLKGEPVIRKGKGEPRRKRLFRQEDDEDDDNNDDDNDNDDDEGQPQQEQLMRLLTVSKELDEEGTSPKKKK